MKTLKYLLLLLLGAVMINCAGDLSVSPTKVTAPIVADAPVQNTSTTNLFGGPTLHGFNWGDEGDNFQFRALLPSGILSTDSYTTIYNKAQSLYTKLLKTTGVNTVRVPINYATVTGPNWSNYVAIFDAANDMKIAGYNFNIIICYWSDGYTTVAGHNIPYGTIDETNWTSAWHIVRNHCESLANHSGIYYEPVNEPYGYSTTDLTNLYARWISNMNCSIANQHRVILAGVNVEENTSAIGNDPRFDNCLLGYHMYSFVYDIQNGGTFNSEPIIALRRRTDWPLFFNSYYQIRQFAARTVITEFGTEQDQSGMNFLNNEGYCTDWGGEKVPYMQGMFNFAYTTQAAGLVYWPGCKNGDHYAMFTGDCTNLSTSPTNPECLNLLQLAWQDNTLNTWDPANRHYSANGIYKITSLQTNKALSMRNGVWASMADYYGGTTDQQWKIVPTGDGYFTIQTSGGGYLEVRGSSTTAGDGVDVWFTRTGDNQVWSIQQDCSGSGDIYIQNKNSSQSLNVRGAATGNWSDCDQWPYDAQPNSKWHITRLN